jgi:hypothetical protein
MEWNIKCRFDCRERKQVAEWQKEREPLNRDGKEIKPNCYQIQGTQKL